MKRRSLIISLLLVAALALSIGYANMTRILTFAGDGTLTRNDDTFIVEFIEDGKTLVDHEGNDLLNTEKGSLNITNGGTTVEFNIKNLTSKGDKAKATIKIQNNSTSGDLIGFLARLEQGTHVITDENGDAISEDPVENGGIGQLIKITYSITNEEGEEVWNSEEGSKNGGLYLAVGETATLTYTVELMQSIVENAKVVIKDADLTLYFNAVKSVPAESTAQS